MINQHTQQQETSAEQAKKRNDGKGIPMAGLGLGIIATAFAIIWLTMFADESSRSSTSSEIAVQKEFQDKWNTAQKVTEQKWDAILVDTSSSRLSCPSELTAQKEFDDKLKTVQEEFQQKVDVATNEAVQKSESIGK
ncbi:MAG: hypothetical protein WC657_08095 [Candidatus Paceibacterota bacterium]|jgi:hypothetical protein